MGTRSLTDWTPTGINSEYSKALPDIEARVRTVTENGADLVLGTINGSLNAGEYFFDYSTKILYVKATGGVDVNTKAMRLYTYYNVFGAWATQAEFNNNEMFAIVKPLSNIYARYFRLFVMKKGNPTFANMRLEIRTELNGYPTSKILATSENVWTDATINAYQNAASEIWFRFNSFGMKKDEKYCIVLKADGTFTENSHVGWLKLDRIYDDGVTDDINAITYGSYRFAVVGVDA